MLGIMSLSAVSASDTFEYDIRNDGVTITKYIGSDTEIEIPAMIEGKAVVSIGDFAFDRCSSITKIIIPDSVISM
jgi:hypothetical protein